jgi:hypothetical protein
VTLLQNRVPKKISGGFKLRIVKQEDFSKLDDENSGAFGTIFQRKSEGKRPLGRLKRKREKMLKSKLKE